MRFFQKERLISLLKNEWVLIGILLITFFLKGTFFVTLFPMFTGQDEARHYNSIQYQNEPAEKTWQTISRGAVTNNDFFAQYNFSEEILNAGTAAGIDDVRGGLYETTHFAKDNFIGPNEPEIIAKEWLPYNRYTQADAVHGSLYHRVAGTIEQAFSGSDILIRFYLIRLFSVLLGTLSIFFAFQIARTIGLGTLQSFMLSAIIAFQPKFAMYFASINYDVLLIPMFFLFTWAAVLSLKQGLTWKNFTLLVSSVIIGLLTKGTAIVLLVAFIILIGFHLFHKVRDAKKLALAFILFAFILTIVAIPFSTRYGFSTLLPNKGGLSQTITELGNYLGKSLTPGHFSLSSRTYWGALGWNNDVVSNNLTDVIFSIEIASAFGLMLYFFRKRGAAFLPERKYIIFLILILVALQLGIRAADFNVFLHTHKLDLGTPGRYFLPNLATHIILVFVGLGALLGTKERFRFALSSGVICMILFSLYLTLDVILPRFYL